MYGLDYGYGYGNDYAVTSVATGFATAAIGMILFISLISFAVCAFSIICMWKVFKKANKPGWAAIIPIYNLVVMLEITELPMWYIALLFVPGANIYAIIKIYIELAKKFGKTVGFGVGLAFLNPIFMAILAFSKNCVFNGNAPVMNFEQQPVQQSFVQPMEPVQPVVQSMQPVQPTVQPMEPVQPVVQPMQPVQPVVQSMQPVQPVVQPMEPVQPVVQPMEPVQPVVQPMQPVQPTVQPIEPVQPVVQPIEPVQPVVQSMEPTVQPQSMESTQSAVCPACGSQLLPGARFCTNCGKQL